MFKYSFKIRHKGCSETELSIKFPKHHITVIDVQSKDARRKQYLYYITGKKALFDEILLYIKRTRQYKLSKEIERSSDTLILLVELHQTSYIQNIIQKYNGFFIELHTVYGGFEYWHIGILDREKIKAMQHELKKLGELKALYIGEVNFTNTLLSNQQKKIFKYAYEMGYYQIPRKTTISSIAKAFKLDHSTVGEHLLKAENKIIDSMSTKLF